MGRIKAWEASDKLNYQKWLNDHKYYTTTWLNLQIIKDLEILEDETVNSIKPLSQHSLRCGKFEQHTFIVCYSFKLKYGYCLNTKQHFKYLKTSQIRDFKVKVSNIDSLFNTVWVKDNRKFGRNTNIEGFINLNKAYTSKIEQLFSNKIAIYNKYKKGLIKSQTDLDNEYDQLFNKLNIIQIS